MKVVGGKMCVFVDVFSHCEAKRYLFFLKILCWRFGSGFGRSSMATLKMHLLGSCWPLILAGKSGANPANLSNLAVLFSCIQSEPILDLQVIQFDCSFTFGLSWMPQKSLFATQNAVGLLCSRIFLFVLLHSTSNHGLDLQWKIQKKTF